MSITPAHCVLLSPAFDDLRQFTAPKYVKNQCEFWFLATQNERTLKNLALFLYEAFVRRKTLLS